VRAHGGGVRSRRGGGLGFGDLNFERVRRWDGNGDWG
jgi:hypothetical protein